MRKSGLNGILASGLALAIGGTAVAAEVAPSDVVIKDNAIQNSLTEMGGNATRGAAAFKNRKLGNCLACHANQDMAQELFHGNVGPALDGVASRWSVPELRAIIVNSKEFFGPETMMPGFYTLKVGKHVAKKHAGETILSAQDIEDIVAYLATLKEE